MRAIAQALPALSADVVAFQEVWTPWARDTLVAAGARAGLPHAWHRNRSFGGSGLLVLSRWPIARHRFRPFTLCGLPQRLQHADYYGGKGFVQVEISAPDGALEVVATHLHAAYGRGVGFEDEYEGHRVAEIVEIAAAVARSSRPIVVMGDLNATPEREEMQVLAGITRLVDAAAAVGHPEATAISGSPYRGHRGAPDERIDYVLARAGARRGLRIVDAGRRFDEEIEIEGSPGAYSDHAGVLAEIEVGGAGTALPVPSVTALQQARGLLDRGRERALYRRDGQRSFAAFGAATALAGGVAGKRSRRSFLRRASLAGAALVLAPSLAATALAEGFTPTELDGYDRVERVLDELLVLTGERRVRHRTIPGARTQIR